MPSHEVIDFSDIGDLDIRDAVASDIEKVRPQHTGDTDDHITQREQKENRYTKEAEAEIGFIEDEARMAAALACIAPKQVLEHYGGEKSAPGVIGQRATDTLKRLSQQNDWMNTEDEK
jgi:hypothetical protein